MAASGDRLSQRSEVSVDVREAKGETTPIKNAEVRMSSTDLFMNADEVNPIKNRYPHCVVWTPIPLLTWLFPFIGHMGIATTAGVIRDFAGPYYVSEDCMGFGNPTKYWQLSLDNVHTGKEAYDRAVYEASEEYKKHMHNLFCDNCHSHVALAMNTMQYDKKTSWNMFSLCFLMLIHGKYVNCCSFIKTWLPFFILVGIIFTAVLITKLT
ncbi:transmembrane protein 222-like [Lingula anatina]|uniref:Transmembrane protein 222-like n=1 Tax=Lingula anatina TaxID=7574 RepID=A0A1S3HEK3_LINAN|nr:transmembrane protein 222-like [Lingula anatina]|eukprot:XP_013384445.1 transmembrane protein 222-like [Lingula anatina]